MKLLTLARTSLAAVAVVALASCSLAESADPAPSTQASAPVSASPAETSSAPETSATEETSAAEETSATQASTPATTEASSDSTGAAGLTACEALTADEVNAALGTKVGEGTKSDTGSLSQCQYMDMSTTTVVVTQIIKAPYDQYVTAMKGQMGKKATTETVTVSGAEKATLITGEVGGPAAAILAKKGAVTYTVMVVTPTSPSAPASAAMVKAATSMLA